MKNHQPFKLLLSINTPIMIKEFAPTFDGLIFDAVRTRYPGFSNEQVLGYMKKIISTTDDIFHASSALMVVTPDVGVVACKQGRIRSSGYRNLTSDWFSPNGAKGKYTRVNTEGGIHKLRKQVHNLYGVSHIVFFGEGIISEITNLLYHSALGVGFSANGSVHGQFGEFVIVPLEEDFSFIYNGNLNRTLPVDFAQALGVKDGRITDSPTRPPYYLKESRVRCLSPDAIRYTSI